MPVRHIRGVDIVYEVLGDSGPWVTVTPGGRRGLVGERPLAALIADAGYRVLVHDRRNMGASGIGFPGDNESREQAEDLLELLRALGTGPAYVAGSSSGARMSLLLAHDHPDMVKGLLLWRVTGGEYAAKRLASKAGVFVEYDASATTTIGQAVYATPTGHIDTIKATLAKNLRSITVAELNSLDSAWQVTPGVPLYFSMDANAPNRITLYPVANAVTTLASIFQKFPATISVASHMLAMPRTVRGYFAFYVLAEARRKESDASMPEMADHFDSRVKMFEQVFEHLYGPSN